MKNVHLLEFVFEFSAKAIEQPIAFSNLFPKLFSVDFTFHLVREHGSVPVIFCERERTHNRVVHMLSYSISGDRLRLYVNQALLWTGRQITRCVFNLSGSLKV